MATPSGTAQHPPTSMMTPPSGPPYAPMTALLGGRPTVDLDVPISAVFLFLFVCGAAGHMTLFQINNKRGHKFILSAMTFGFCMARIAALTMRIVWANRPTNTNIAIAANVLTAAGVVILFIVNLIFAQRIVRATHPNLGWHRGFSLVFKVFYVVLVLSLFVLVGLTVTTFFTLDPNLRMIARDLQWYGQSAFLLFCFLPLPLVLGAVLTPHATPIDKFGTGSFRAKVAIVLIGTTLLTLGAAFRLGTSVLPPRAPTDPAWYQSKECYYLFNFTIEIIVVYLYLFARIDVRFHVPNGARGHGSYRNKGPAKETDDIGLSEETDAEKERERIEAQEAV